MAANMSCDGVITAAGILVLASVQPRNDSFCMSVCLCVQEFVCACMGARSIL